MTPGDKATFTISVTNYSNVKVKYRTKIAVSNDTGLFSGLKFNIGGVNVESSSIWKNLDPATEGGTAVSSYDCYVELPSDKDNDYQNKSCEIAYTVEAVQGNAATANDEIVSIGYATATAAVESTDNMTTNAVSLTSADSVAVSESETKAVASATVPQGTKLENGVSSLTLNIYETETDDSNFTVESIKEDDTLAVKTLEVEMKGLDNTNNDRLITVYMYVGEGLTNFSLYHNSVEMDCKESESAVVDDQDYYYNTGNGFVTMITKKFSPFTCVYDAVAVTEVASMYELSVESSASWARIVQPGHYKLTSDITTSKFLCFNAGGVYINLNGKTLTIDGKSFRTNADVVNAKFSNGTIIIKNNGNLWQPSWGTTNLTFKDVNVESNCEDVIWARASSKECRLNIIGDNFNITNSRFLWACPDNGSEASPSKVNVKASGVNVKQTNYTYLEAVMLQTQYKYGEVVANFDNCNFDSSARDSDTVKISSYASNNGNSISLTMNNCSLIARANANYIGGYSASNVNVTLNNCTGRDGEEITL